MDAYKRRTPFKLENVLLINGIDFDKRLDFEKHYLHLLIELKAKEYYISDYTKGIQCKKSTKFTFFGKEK